MNPALQRDLILLGAGGHASVVAETAVAAGWRIVGYLAEEAARDNRCSALAVPWLGTVDRPAADVERLWSLGARVHTAVGDARLRERWSSRFEPERLATIVHPLAWVGPSAVLGPGSYVGAFAAVNACASVGVSAIINTGSIIEHDVRIGSYAHCAPRSVIAGMAAIGERTLVGAGAVVLPFVKVAADAIVGAGAVVRRNVESGTTVVGTPARALVKP